jgi:hypothetical protein
LQLDPGNALILRQHLACAAAELVLMADLDGPLFGGAGAYGSTCRGLEDIGYLAADPQVCNPCCWVLTLLSNPAPNQNPALAPVVCPLPFPKVANDVCCRLKPDRWYITA